MKTTTSRDGEPYSGELLAGARDVFGALSQSSQFKVSLHLSSNGSNVGDGNLNNWLQASGLTNDPIQNEYYNFYCAEAELPGTTLNTRDVAGNFQGIEEKFAVNRQYLPIRLTFYVDNDYRLIRLFEEWMNYINPLYGDGFDGGSQSAGGGAGSVSDTGTAGSALQGGPGAGGGGGGYFGGGGGGGHNGCCADGAGGGGSAYIGSSLLTDGRSEHSAGAAAATDGSFEITATETSVSVPIKLTISGSTSNVLTVSGDAAVSATAKVVVSNSNAFNSPLTSESRTFTATTARPLIKIEQINNTNTATLSEHDLDDGEITFTDDAYPSNQICIYSPERDIEIEMDLFGGKGSDNGANVGGEGGKSTIKFTLDQNVEYIITGLYDEVNAPFVYRKASLIAVVGEGGDASATGDGGNGGGVNIGGQDGQGRFNGVGGTVVSSGDLTNSGVFGTQYTDLENVYAEDSVASVAQYGGGRTVKCSKGVYYRDEGFTPCEDIGTVKFRLSNGTEVQNTSASITRGFKSGYNIMETGGNAFEETGNNGADGGNGATGGFAGSTDGGGGGSGYTDGSVTVVSTQQGGSTGAAKVVIRLAS